MSGNRAKPDDTWLILAQAIAVQLPRRRYARWLGQARAERWL